MANKINSNGIMISVGMDLNTDKANAAFMKAMSKFQEQAVIEADVKINNDVLTKAIKTYKDNLGNIITETNVFSRSWGNVQREITSIKTPLEQVNEELARQANEAKKATEAQQNLNATAKKGVSIFQDFASTFLKMAKFNTINMIYDGIASSLSKCVEITNDFNSAMIEFKKVTDTSNMSMSDYLETLDKLGQTVGFSRTEMLEAATEYSKAGYDADTAAQLARVSSLYRNIADEELSAGDAASYVISQLKAFGMETDNVAETTKNALSIIDKTNEVKLFVTS